MDVAGEIDRIREQHERIEQYLIDLETLMDEEELNYSALVHTLREFVNFWDRHEELEESVFKKIKESKKIKIPYHKVVSDHGEFKKTFECLVKEINEGRNSKVLECLNNKGRKLISDIRKHMEMEEQIMYMVPQVEV